LLSEQGCHQLTMDEVAKRVGIAKGNLYLHAAARNDLVARVLGRGREEA
jgi:AcrR family transcriptional regulator